jgi:hypothetical protein
MERSIAFYRTIEIFFKISLTFIPKIWLTEIDAGTVCKNLRRQLSI